MEKLAKIIANNFGLKILAVVIAVIVWMVIVNVEDPDKTKVYTVPVTIQNESYLTDQNKTYEVLNNTDTITFTVSAKRSVIERISASDFLVEADMENITSENKVPIVILAQKYVNQLSIMKKNSYLELNVEDIVEKTFDVSVETAGKVSGGYLLSDVTTDPKSITVSGAESLVNQIDTVAAPVDVSNLKENASVKSQLVFYDKKKNVIDTKRLTLSDTSVKVSVGIYQEKTVPVEYIIHGTPANEYRTGTVKGSIEELKIVGTPDDLASVDKVTVSGNVLSVTGRTSDLEVTVDLRDYLPKGVSVAEDEKSESDVVVDIEGMIETSYDMPVANIDIVNVPDGYVVKADAYTVAVVLRGYESDLEDVTAASLSGTASGASLIEGAHKLTVLLDGSYTVTKPIVLDVTVTKTESTPSPEPTQDPADGTDDTNTDASKDEGTSTDADTNR